LKIEYTEISAQAGLRANIEKLENN
jgi:uncharacterized protein (UPF0335 family)